MYVTTRNHEFSIPNHNNVGGKCVRDHYNSRLVRASMYETV